MSLCVPVTGIVEMKVLRILLSRLINVLTAKVLTKRQLAISPSTHSVHVKPLKRSKSLVSFSSLSFVIIIIINNNPYDK